MKFKAVGNKIPENFNAKFNIILLHVTHFEITFYLCNLTGSKQYDLFTNFTFFVLNRNISVQNRIMFALISHYFCFA